MNFKETLRIAFAIFLLGIVILIHEFGHFTMCKLFDINTPTFSIGFGPALLQKRIGGTTFQIALLPLGGYVSMNAHQLQEAPYWQKMIITLAGIFNNFLLALILLILLFYRNRIRFKPTIKKIVRDSPATHAGLQVDDYITHIDGTSINNNADILLHTIQINPYKTIVFTIEREGKPYEIPIQIGTHMVAGKAVGYLGIILEKDFTQTSSLVNVIHQATNATWNMMRISFYLITTFFKPASRQTFTGPIGIVSLTSQSLQQGFNVMLFFVASISIELGVFNVLPIPLLDGGQAFYYTLEALLGHALTSHDLTIIYFIYLMLLVAFALYLNRKNQRGKKIFNGNKN
jgi:regulator of sigma E protease